MKLSMYVDPAWKRGYPHSPLLFPFWGNALTDRTPYQKALFDRHAFDTKKYEVTEDISAADVVFLPYRYHTAIQKEPKLIEVCHRAAVAHHKPLLIDATGDVEYPITLSRTFALRVGGYRFLKRDTDITVPQYADDLLEVAGKRSIILREKNLKPIIGFTGWASLDRLTALRTIVKEFPTRVHSMFDPRYGACKKGIFFRMQALEALQRSPSVKTNFLIRSSYSGHTATATDDPETLRKAFIDNLLQSDYGLDVRGDSNSSQRLFETLSLGRIPIIVDTERNLPFSDSLNYSAFSFVIDFRELELLPMKLAHFHASLTPEQFEDMQRKAREVFRHFFRVDALISHIANEIRARLLRV